MDQRVGIRRPAGHLRLLFGEAVKAKAVESLSAVEQIGDTLWLAPDEGTAIVRLTTTDFYNYGDPAVFSLGDYFKLPLAPAEENSEVDLEGFAIDREKNRLWVVGSHSMRRDKPSKDDAGPDRYANAAAQLTQTGREANRCLLGYLELELTKQADGEMLPTPKRGVALPFAKESSSLIDMLRGDTLLAPFLDIPSKDNGLDIEGLACRGDTVFVGLRGPVLRGWGTILQIELVEIDGVLEPKKAGTSPYLQHLLHLDGLGIRDLCVMDDDLLILAGPTMDLDGPVKLYRWHGGTRQTAACRVDTKPDLELMFEIPWGEGVDHAEGIALFRNQALGQSTKPGTKPEAAPPPELVVVYDSPAKTRMHDGRYFSADLFAI